ncbi:hypothetical protein KAW64_03610 [bacterium]|nr:hypothetical protein [bacterium]
MRTILALLMVAALCVPAFAGGNPNVAAYVSFDQTGAGAEIHQYDMTQYVGFNAYFVFADLDMGLTVVSFMINNPMVEYPGLFASQSFTNLLDLMAGDPFTGMSLASTTCRPAPLVVVGYLNLFPVAIGDACVVILDDPDFPRWVVDCTTPNGEVDFYWLETNGTIGAATCPPGDISPVEDATWGSIKAMYR